MERDSSWRESSWREVLRGEWLQGETLPMERTAKEREAALPRHLSLGSGEDMPVGRRDSNGRLLSLGGVEKRRASLADVESLKSIVHDDDGASLRLPSAPSLCSFFDGGSRLNLAVNLTITSASSPLTGGGICACSLLAPT